MKTKALEEGKRRPGEEVERSNGYADKSQG